MGGIDVLGGVFDGVAKIVGTFKMSPADRAKLQQSLFELQLKANQQALDYEARRVAESAKTIRAEANSDHWLAASWRPIVMLALTGLIALHWLGLTTDLPDDQILSLFQLVKIGLGGYVVGRSGEKIAREWKRVSDAGRPEKP